MANGVNVHVHVCASESVKLLQNPNLTKFHVARIIRTDSYGASTAVTHLFSLPLTRLFTRYVTYL